MIQRGSTHAEFERLVRQFLATHPQIGHEWHRVDSVLTGGRTELTCTIGNLEVPVTLRDYQIVVGDTDFEDFGTGKSEAEIANDALAFLISSLQASGAPGLNTHASQRDV